MKTYIVLVLSILSLFFDSCKPKNDIELELQINNKIKIEDSRILKIIDKYTEGKKQWTKVLLLYMEESRKDTIKFVLGFKRNSNYIQDELLQYPPIGFFRYKSRLVLVFSSISKFYNNDEYIRQVMKEIGNSLEPDDATSCRTDFFWRITMVKDKIQITETQPEAIIDYIPILSKNLIPQNKR